MTYRRLRRPSGTLGVLSRQVRRFSQSEQPPPVRPGWARPSFPRPKFFFLFQISSSVFLAQQHWTQTWHWPSGSQFPESSGGSSAQRFQLQIFCKQPIQIPGYSMSNDHPNIKVPSTLQAKTLGTWGLMYAERFYLQLPVHAGKPEIKSTTYSIISSRLGG